MPKNPQDTISDEAMAAGYGWSYAFLKQNPELYKVFKTAVAEGWGGPLFVSKVRSTKWYRTMAEPTRQYEVLRATDPAEWKRRQAQSEALVSGAYERLWGSKPNPKLLRNMAGLAFKLGYSEEQITDMIGRSANASNLMKNGIGGTIGEAEQAIRKGMEDYGVDLSDSWMSRQLNYIATGRADAGATIDYLRNVAKNKYRAFAQQIDQGMTVKDIAEPYIQLAAKTLEISDGGISVSDKNIQKALLAVDDKNQPAAKPLWQFEQDLKNDPRWLRTQNSQDSIMAAGRKVLADFGFSN